MDARIDFRIVAGINGRTQVLKPIQNELFVRKQNIRIPHIKLKEFPKKIPRIKLPFHLLRYSIPSPMTYAINGKERIKPPVGPASDPRPPVKFAKTGNPIAPSSIYIKVERAPFLEPRMIPASVMANVCIVNGTPKGIGMDICAMITMTAVNNPMRHRFCMFEFLCFIFVLHFIVY